MQTCTGNTSTAVVRRRISEERACGPLRQSRGLPLGLTRSHRKAVALFLVLVSSPLGMLYFPHTGLPISITPYRIVFLLVAPFVAFKVLTDGNVKLELPLLLPILILIGVINVSYLRTDELFSKWASFNYLREVLFVSTLLVVMIIANSEENLDRAMEYLVVTAVCIAALGWLDMFLMYSHHFDMWRYMAKFGVDSGSLMQGYQAERALLPRISATFPDPNLLAYYLLMPLAITLNALAGDKSGEARTKKRRVTNMLSALFIWVTILGTLSRSGIGCSFVIFVWIFLRSRSGRSGRFWVVSAVIVTLCLVLVFCIYYFKADYVVAMFDRIQGSSVSERVIRAESALTAFRSNPILGVGLGNLGFYIPPVLRKSYILTSHCFYLDILSADGLIGLVPLLFFIGYILVGLRNSERDRHNPINLISTATLVALCITQLVYSNLWDPAVAVEMGIIASVVNLRSKRARTRRVPIALSRRSLAGADGAMPGGHRR